METSEPTKYSQQLWFPQLKERELLEPLLEDFYIKHLGNCGPFLLWIQPRRFSQSHTAAQGGSQS